MTLILIALVVLTFISVYMAVNSCTFIGGMLAPIFALIGFIGLAVYAFLIFSYIAAEHEAKIINREYGTNYSQIEVFYARGVIETIRELDRKRIEVNGDLITGK
jgi:Fe2+ transport system protein B